MMITRTGRIALAAIVAATGLAGCGGAKVLKQAAPIEQAQPLATARDQRVSAVLDWVIVRDGPGSWAVNVDWDEYLVRVRNETDSSIQVSRVSVVDSLGHRLEVRTDRSELVAGTKETRQRYRETGTRIRVGAGMGGLVTTAGAAAATGTALGVAAAGGWATAGGAAMLGGIIFVPVMAAGGVVRSVNHGRVEEVIGSRQTPLPGILEPGEEQGFDLFFPLAPSPQRLEIDYLDMGQLHTLTIDTREALAGLHLAAIE